MSIAPPSPARTIQIVCHYDRGLGCWVARRAGFLGWLLGDVFCSFEHFACSCTPESARDRLLEKLKPARKPAVFF